RTGVEPLADRPVPDGAATKVGQAGVGVRVREAETVGADRGVPDAVVAAGGGEGAAATADRVDRQPGGRTADRGRDSFGQGNGCSRAADRSALDPEDAAGGVVPAKHVAVVSGDVVKLAGVQLDAAVGQDGAGQAAKLGGILRGRLGVDYAFGDPDHR